MSKKNRYVCASCELDSEQMGGGVGGVILGNSPGLLSGNRGQTRDPRGNTAKN